MESRTSTLPKLIFLEEHHLSPLLSDLLTEWSPKLKNKGYSVFYDESPPSDNLSTLIDLFESQFKKGKQEEPLFETIYALVNTLLENGHYLDLPEQILDTIDKNNIPLFNAAKKFVSIISLPIVAAYLQVEELIIENKVSPEIMANIINHINNILYDTKLSIRNSTIVLPQAETKFYRTLQFHQIRYQGIDENADMDVVNFQIDKKIEESNSIEEICQAQGTFQTLLNKATSMKCVKLRDSKLIKPYLMPELAFGKVGAFHAIGLQKLILENMTIEEAASAYTFIYPVDRPPYNERTKKLREELVNNLPLKVLIIDLMDKSNINLDEILDKIISNNNNKINEVPISSCKYKFFLLGNNPSPEHSQDEKPDQSIDQKRFSF